MYAPLYHNDFPAELPPFIIVSIKPKVSVSFWLEISATFFTEWDYIINAVLDLALFLNDK
jgi:hypothetical protein